jgi:hypothetical protein
MPKMVGSAANAAIIICPSTSGTEGTIRLFVAAIVNRALKGSLAKRPVTMIGAWSLTSLLVVLNAVLLLQSV